MCASGTSQQECMMYCSTECVEIKSGAKVTTQYPNGTVESEAMQFYCPDKSEIRNTSYTETYCLSYNRNEKSVNNATLEIFCQNQVECAPVRSDTFAGCNRTTGKCNDKDVSRLFFTIYN